MEKVNAVYTIVDSKDKDGNLKSDFILIGKAFSNKDGSLNVVLNAIPVNGKLHIRPFKKNGSSKANG